MKRKMLLATAFVLVLLAAVTSFFLQTKPHCCHAQAAPIVNWGLSPNTNEQTPRAPEDGVELLNNYNGLFVGPTDEKKVYLTFDLGYEAGHTTAVLDTLKENNIKGVFFLCGNYLQEEDIINRIISEGHTIGNHTNHHKDLPKLDTEKMKEDINSLTEKFKEKYGEKYNKPLLHFRPPKGRFNEAVLKAVADEGMKTIMWSVAIVDWGKSPIDAQKSADKIASRIHPGAIVLMHITNSGTPEMLKLLIPQLLAKGYTFGDAGAL